MSRRADGDHGSAEEVLTGAIRREDRRGQADFLALALAAAVEAAVERGDTQVADDHNARLQALDDDAGAAGIAVTMARLHAQAITHGDVLAATTARHHAVRHGLVADAGRALGVIGALRGDAGLLDEAYRELGAVGALRRQRAVARELRRTGRRVPHSTASREQFSPVEGELVSLVTDGLTNRQVADRMGLSAKTVEVYLSRIYRKAGLRSRVELAVAVRDGRLGTPAER
jgi:DNA-binding CsgD family transcriptional regulator